MWRVGGKVPLNVYNGDRPVCQCHTAEDAAKIVVAMNYSEARILKGVSRLMVRPSDTHSFCPECLSTGCIEVL